MVAAVAAPASTSSRKYKQCEPIYETKFSFTDQHMAWVRYRSGVKHDRRYDEKIAGLSIQVRKMER